MISSPSRTWRNPTASPLRSVVLTLMMPFPPRPWTRYSLTGVRFPYPPFGDRQNCGRRVGGDCFHPDDFVAFLERDAAHPVGRPSHGPHVVFLEADGDALFRARQNFPLAIGDLHADEFVPVYPAKRDDAALARIAVGREFGLLDDALLRSP